MTRPLFPKGLPLPQSLQVALPKPRAQPSKSIRRVPPIHHLTHKIHALSAAGADIPRRGSGTSPRRRAVACEWLVGARGGCRIARTAVHLDGPVLRDRCERALGGEWVVAAHHGHGDASLWSGEVGRGWSGRWVRRLLSLWKPSWLSEQSHYGVLVVADRHLGLLLLMLSKFWLLMLLCKLRLLLLRLERRLEVLLVGLLLLYGLLLLLLLLTEWITLSERGSAVLLRCPWLLHRLLLLLLERVLLHGLMLWKRLLLRWLMLLWLLERLLLLLLERLLVQRIR